MSRSLPSFGVPVLLVLLTLPAACNSDSADVSVTSPTPLVASTTIESSFGVEPSTVRPEMLPGSCAGQSPFGVRLALTLRGAHELILRGLRFSHTDRFGTRSLPDVFPIPSVSAPLPSGGRIPFGAAGTLPGVAPLPASSPIPIPGSSPIAGVLVSPSSSILPVYLLRFGCGVVPDGFVWVNIDMADRKGRLETSELRVRIGA